MKTKKTAKLMLLMNLAIILITMLTSISFHSEEAYAINPAIYDAQFNCGTTGTEVKGSGITDSVRAKIVELAKTRLGVPYEWGGTDWESGMDCSAFTMLTYQKAGLQLPRTSQEQSKVVKKIDKEAAKEGDLVFWGEVGKSTHVAIYLGEDQIIHEPDLGEVCKIQDLYGEHWFGTIDGLDEKNDSKGDEEETSEYDLPNVQNIKPIYDYMNGTWGLSVEAIAGILGNWVVESRINHYSVEGNFSPTKEAAIAAENGLMGVGYGQWTAGRHTALVNWGKEHFNGKWYESEAQLDFMFKGDGGFVAILKNYALNSTDSAVDNAVEFHRVWEISADSPSIIAQYRGEPAKRALAYMKANGMNGKKDTDKINLMGTGEEGDGKESSSNVGGTVEDVCETDEVGQNQNNGSGEMGQSTQINGKHGQVIKNMRYEDALKEYGNAITLPKFQEPDWSTSPFQGILQGQCTELTWAYMSQLYDGQQPTMGHGGFVWQSYEAAGAKVTDKPTVGYGFSASDGYLWAVGEYGHTGVVVGVFDDGSFLTANFNIPPTQAPTRGVTITLIDGVDKTGSVKFFSGVGNAKVKTGD